MGISKYTLSLLIELKNQVGFNGAICQLGKQDAYFNLEYLNNKLNNNNKLFNDNKINSNVSDKILFKELGFTEVYSIDANNFENATFILDLNYDIPSNLNEKFDFIIDGGTMEHVFDTKKCLSNIHKMLKPGGFIVHLNPINNHVDHGFYQFSPTFYYDYYSTNKYSIIHSYIVNYSRNDIWKSKIYKYSPGIIDHLAHGGWGRELLAMWFVVQKNNDSTSDCIPQQFSYKTAWKKNENNIIDMRPSLNVNIHFIKIKNFMRNFKFLYKLIGKIYDFYISYLCRSNMKPKIHKKYP
jgi:SAM-dependent methyltransferase